jgi:hypothetical protein
MECWGYQGVWLMTDTDNKKTKRFSSWEWAKSVPKSLHLQGEYRSRQIWFYSTLEYRNNFHNSSSAFEDRERDA